MSHVHQIEIGWYVGAVSQHAYVGGELRWVVAPFPPSLAHVVVGSHGHRLVITDADIASGVEKVYDVRGSAAHGHQVTITAAMFTALAAARIAAQAVYVNWGNEAVKAAHVALTPAISTTSGGQV